MKTRVSQFTRLFSFVHFHLNVSAPDFVLKQRQIKKAIWKQPNTDRNGICFKQGRGIAGKP